MSIAMKNLLWSIILEYLEASVILRRKMKIFVISILELMNVFFLDNLRIAKVIDATIRIQEK